MIPAAVRRIAAGAELTLVWENAYGGLTYRVGERCYLKWAPIGSGIELAAEAARLRWAAAFTSVPPVLQLGQDGEGSWLVTRPLPGDTAVSPRWRADPGVAVRAIGRGLRALHDALPVATCPYSWSATERLAETRRRAQHRALDPAVWHPDHRALGVEQALAKLDAVPAIDRLVVCHGDACAPNTILRQDGAVSGHVDLGALGVADRWADLAIATWSAGWNYGPGWEPALLDAYGVAPDRARTGYYRLLYEMGP